MTANVRDLLIVVSLFFVSWGLAHVSGVAPMFIQHAPSWLSALPFALSVLAGALLWWCVRKGRDQQQQDARMQVELETLRAEIEERTYAQEHAQLLSATKNEILENEYQRAERLEQLHRLGLALAAANSPDELKTVAADSLKEMLPHHTVGLMMAERGFRNWTLAARWGAHADTVHEHINPESCWVLRQGDVYRDCSNTQNMQCEEANMTTIKTVACYPIFYRDFQFGVLHIRSDQLDAELLSHEAENMVRTVCDSIGLHLYNAQLLEELSLASNRDALTGLLNRRGLGNTLKREVLSAIEQTYDVSVAMLDIDHFKQYNDTYGHQEGDKALKFVAEVLARHIRSRDIVARYGGEEFMLILPNTPKVQAFKKLQALIAKVATLSQDSPECKRPITLSVGLATAPVDNRQEDTLVKCADLALYAAKKQGRNRVVAYKKPRQDTIPVQTR